MARLVPRLTRGIISSAAAPRPQGAIGGVDLRVFNGIDGFIGKQQMDRVNEWQAGLWQRLADEVRSECLHYYSWREADACALFSTLPISLCLRDGCFNNPPTADV